jgi:hypothetical protein
MILFEQQPSFFPKALMLLHQLKYRVKIVNHRSFLTFLTVTFVTLRFYPENDTLLFYERDGSVFLSGCGGILPEKLRR